MITYNGVPLQDYIQQGTAKGTKWANPGWVLEAHQRSRAARRTLPHDLQQTMYHEAINAWLQQQSKDKP